MIRGRPPLRLPSASRVLGWGSMCLMFAVIALPVWMALKTALVQPSQVFEQSSALWPKEPTLVNFKRVLGLLGRDESLALAGSAAQVNILNNLWRSVCFTFIVTVVQTCCAAAAGYAFARLRFRGRDLLFAGFVATLLVPSVATFIPNFILVKQLGLLDTMLGMVAPFALMQGFSIFYLRQAFLSLPTDLLEAARLEGASHWQVFVLIALPLSVTPIVSIGTVTALAMWNEYFWPYLVARDVDQAVLPVALQAFRTQRPQGQPDWTGLMAAATVAALPAVVLLLAFGRRVVESVQRSGGR